ncbi:MULTISPECIES: hypothetical protein [unclassified Prochlorococcus]|uniref:hypothetical protein n=1 Tax=unclassified Prochlorococcus TaxID=2627481 RepID=UPI00053383DF|nr:MULTISPECIES: hypothetical protein [unclassified Prochlorococcus]KGG26753.1 hypothetical protein EV13_2419 [Prochlorococcus sp. MIT 0702]KGG29383.1 hypothetical protein EV12_0165 [Prochlorococcus sp. MIT 0701]KGG33684.1 hypothetical protein EV14_1573 [Prochlorococcus sp. MIT 0703]
MSLTELMVASLLLVGSATSGLHVWGQASLAAHVGWLKEEQLESVELQLLAGQRWLSGVGHGSELLTANGSCRFDLAAVSRSADMALPLPEELERHWQAYGAGLWLEIDAKPLKGSPVEPLRRRQLLTPAGTGWCRPTLKAQS